MSEACQAGGVSRTAVHQWRREDPAFYAAWEDALESGTDLLETEAIRRAMAGSDTLLIFLLKARRPIYREARVMHGGIADAPPIAVGSASCVTIYLPENGRDAEPD